MQAAHHSIDWIRRHLCTGQVIPAHPLALDRNRRLDERRQRALTRYYHQAGAGGVAVGVHTTQFAIRNPQHGLYRPVLELASETLKSSDAKKGRSTIRIAGICGKTSQAILEANMARELGYHAGLLSLAAFPDGSDDKLIDHCRLIAETIPLVGFYLQPAAGGRRLSYKFWRRFVDIPNVVAIKIAPFNRYQTLDVVRAVAESGRAGEIALYTGNDDNILMDLLTEFVIPTDRGEVRLHMAGGLLGHWACWTRTAVEHLNRCNMARLARSIPSEMMTLAIQVTEANGAFFDASNAFAGCIAGIHEVLRRQGILDGTWCLDPSETLSPGQAAEIERICRIHPGLNDDDFVIAHRDEWMTP